MPITPLLTFISISITDIFDIVFVAILLYQLYRLIRGTAAFNIFIGIFAVFALWQIVKVLQMKMLSGIIEQIISVGVIALIIIFQTEIRQFLLFLGTPKFLQTNKNAKLFFGWMQRLNKTENIQKQDIEELVAACDVMAKTRTGALIVLTKKSQLPEVIKSGTMIEGHISQRLIQNIFFKNSPLHDGAVVIAENQIKSAGCVLPITSNPDFPQHLGLRHRASVGITERSDSIAITVSEETGSISVCKSGNITYNIPANKLRKFLNQEFLEQV